MDGIFLVLFVFWFAVPRWSRRVLWAEPKAVTLLSRGEKLDFFRGSCDFGSFTLFWQRG